MFIIGWPLGQSHRIKPKFKFVRSCISHIYRHTIYLGITENDVTRGICENNMLLPDECTGVAHWQVIPALKASNFENIPWTLDLRKARLSQRGTRCSTHVYKYPGLLSSQYVTWLALWRTQWTSTNGRLLVLTGGAKPAQFRIKQWVLWEFHFLATAREFCQANVHVIVSQTTTETTSHISHCFCYQIHEYQQ